MLNIQEVETYKIPGLPRLNKTQLGFFVDIMNGEEPAATYCKHYLKEPVPERIDITLRAKAAEIIGAKWFQSYQKYYEKLMFEREVAESGWTFDLAILERRRLYHLNLLEVERLANAYNKEIEYYTNKKLQAIENDEEDKVEYYEKQILKATKSKNMSLASNQACQQALDGLDKLAGLQTVNLNHTGNVSFYGEDMWDDNTKL